MRKSDGNQRAIVERAIREFVGEFTAKGIQDWIVANYVRVPTTRDIGWILKHLHKEGRIILVQDKSNYGRVYSRRE